VARRKKESGAQYLLLFVVVFLLVFLTFVIGAGIILVWLFREITFPKRIAELKDCLGFTETELEAIRKLEELGRQLLAERHTIEAEGSTLSRRNDGYFHGRSNLGKKLNARLEPIVEQGKRTEAELLRYRHAPNDRRSECVDLGAKLASSRVAVLCLALVGSSIALFQPAWAVGLGNWIISYGLWLPALDPTLYTASIISTWSAVGLYFVVREMAKGTIEETLSGSDTAALSEAETKSG